jgi:hypothetical protein
MAKPKSLERSEQILKQRRADEQLEVAVRNPTSFRPVSDGRFLKAQCGRFHGCLLLHPV